MNLRDRILAAVDIPLKSVPVPEWDCSVNLRPWTLNEKLAFHRWVKENPNEQVLSKALQLSVCDDMGQPVFSAHDLELLGSKNSLILERLSKEVFALNGLSDNEIEAKKKD